MKQHREPVRRVLVAAAALLLVGLAALPPGAFAQSSGASLSGRVVDDDGAALPGVTVTATNTATGLTRVATTAEDGGFRLPSLPVGDYDVKVELSGFGTVTVEDVQLNVATERELDVTMSSPPSRRRSPSSTRRRWSPTSPSIGTVVSAGGAREPAAERPPVRQPRRAGAGHQPGATTPTRPSPASSPSP